MVSFHAHSDGVGVEGTNQKQNQAGQRHHSRYGPPHVYARIVTWRHAHVLEPPQCEKIDDVEANFERHRQAQ